MRWKLFIIASLLAAIVGAGACISLAYFLGFDTPGIIALTTPLVATIFLLPAAAITYASIFVYRHTARRRALQATATALLSIILTLAFLCATALFFNQRQPREERPMPVPAPDTAG
jgi:hypothetical protein